MSAPVTDRSAVTQLALADAARRLQLQARAALIRDTAKVWPVLDFQRLDSSWPKWLQVMLALIGRYHATSTAQAGLYYRASRQHAIGDPGPANLIREASVPSSEQITRALGYAAPGRYAQWTGTNGATPAVAERHALVSVLGTSSRLALDGGRQTLIDTTEHDDKATGWYRVTDGDPCAFCAILSIRVNSKHGGGVYKKASADFKAHNDCGCSAAPSFGAIELSPISQEASDIYYQNPPNLPAFRKAWLARDTAKAATS